MSIPNNDLILGTDQGIHLTNYKTDVLYVSSSGSGYGLTMNDAAKLTSALLNYLNDGGKVIFINGVYDLSDVVEIYNKNIQFIGNASTITNKNDKSLFIPRITPKLLSMKKVKKVLLIQIIFYHFPSCKNPPFYEFAQH